MIAFLMFSASDQATARRYYASIRLTYKQFLLEKPLLIDVSFCIIRDGKPNPEVERLYEFVFQN
jgi:hypothetical protein